MYNDFISEARIVLQTEIDELISLAARVDVSFVAAVKALRRGLEERGKFIRVKHRCASQERFA